MNIEKKAQKLYNDKKKKNITIYLRDDLVKKLTGFMEHSGLKLTDAMNLLIENFFEVDEGEDDE